MELKEIQQLEICTSVHLYDLYGKNDRIEGNFIGSNLYQSFDLQAEKFEKCYALKV